MTGVPGAGKSLALELFRELGCAVLSTDGVVHDLYRDAEIRQALRERWGESVFSGEEVDRAAVAARVFNSSTERVWLEDLLWPRVGQAVCEWVQQQRSGSEASRGQDGPQRQDAPRALVVEVPLLFEANWQDHFDATVTIAANQELIKERAAKKSTTELNARAQRQLTQAEKISRADYVIENNGSVADLRTALAALLYQ